MTWFRVTATRPLTIIAALALAPIASGCVIAVVDDMADEGDTSDSDPSTSGSDASTSLSTTKSSLPAKAISRVSAVSAAKDSSTHSPTRAGASCTPATRAPSA